MCWCPYIYYFKKQSDVLIFESFFKKCVAILLGSIFMIYGHFNIFNILQGVLESSESVLWPTLWHPNDLQNHLYWHCFSCNCILCNQVPITLNRIMITCTMKMCILIISQIHSMTKVYLVLSPC